MMERRIKAGLIALFILTVLLSGGLFVFPAYAEEPPEVITQEEEEQETEEEEEEEEEPVSDPGDGGADTTTVISMVGKYDSADTAPVVRVNEERRLVTLRNHDLGRNYTLYYDDTSHILDAYGNETAVSALTPGTLVQVTFLKSSKLINTIEIASPGNGVFILEEQRDYKLPVRLSAIGVSLDAMATVAGDRYLMDVRTLILIDGKESNAYSILDGDVITVCGADREIFCVTVTRGHGYLRLSSDTVGENSLVGAWIELDNKVIRKISPHMLMTAPEGDYTLYIIGNGADYSTDITISRGRETIVDTAVIPIEPPKSGSIRFELTPADTEVRIDGTVQSVEDALLLTYGIHVLELSAPGYETMLRYLRVGSPSAVVRLSLVSDGTSRENSVSSASSGVETAASSLTGATGTDNTSAGESTAGTGSGATAATNTGSSDSAGTRLTNDQTNGTGTATGATADTTTITAPDSGQIPSSGNTSTAGGNYHIFVDTPVGADLYVDGYYIGEVPTSFEKTDGTHTVTLKQAGYQTISYNIEIEALPGDKSYRFPLLNAQE